MARKKPIARPRLAAGIPLSPRPASPRPSSPAAPTPRVATPRATPPATAIAPSRPRPLARAHKKQAEQLVHEAIRLRKDIDTKFYALGLNLRELSRPEMYRQLGYESFEDLLTQRDLVTRPTAFKVISIVDELEERTARNFGVEKSYGVVRYAKIAHENRTVTEVVALDPFIRHEGKRVRLSAISGRALNAHVSALQAAAGQPPEIPKARFEKATRSLSQLLLHAGVDADRVKTKPRRNKAPIILIALQLEEAEDLIELVKSLS